MRLIDADCLKEKGHFDDYDMFIVDYDDIDNAPTVDAVEVVRCKDCRWGREVCGNIECFVDLNLPPEYHGYEWFCPNGERGENADN